VAAKHQKKKKERKEEGIGIASDVVKRVRIQPPQVV